MCIRDRYKNKIVTEKESILTAQDLLDIKEVNQDIGITKDKRYIKILELSCIKDVYKRQPLHSVAPLKQITPW